MNFALSSDQQALLDGLAPILARHQEMPREGRLSRHYYDHGLDQALADGGFLDIASVEEFSPLEAALVVDAIGTLPSVVEAATTLLVAPKVLPSGFPRPVTLISGPLHFPQRYLPVAKIALYQFEGDLLAIEVDPDNVELADSIFAYPYGRFRQLPDLDKATRLGPDKIPILQQWWRVALAVEAGRAMEQAVNFTVDYVRERHLFGRALGSFQTVQHRLAEGHQYARGARYLALRAAWSSDPVDAATAATYAQIHIDQTRFDTHQFNGGMGISNEHLLHFWTYRMRALESEMGGPGGNAVAVSRLAFAA
ncbi:acyl-CoA dehydrogenase family protein [Sphingomonas immobilis]|uniref:Acyl-CoA dehydrogenase family protein n=1 Tax=Sphingomonas immobilis TaxID=3063997 RepID=A0ABT9A1C7_9SPHN|nr:acyl-CoA dehydrogenase family protein [Sphingomonas sp. CA1-15]MDO7843630.1 acyl-CoA dehydrogenase family protein [Sphingomonas sp. CA1-15]